MRRGPRGPRNRPKARSYPYIKEEGYEFSKHDNNENEEIGAEFKEITSQIRELLGTKFTKTEAKV